MAAKAFCPGHVTGFFQICRGRDLLATGSRGAGMCLTLGATSTVKVEDARAQRILVSLNGRPAKAQVTRAAIARMLGNEKVKVTVRTSLDLPQSQGFGMSGAGALSASIALGEILGRARQEAFEAAHVAEVYCSTGLGDVSAIWRGGITIRKKAGLPPIGEVLRIEGEPEVVLAVVGPRLLTRKVLTNPAKRATINRAGSAKVEALLRRRSLDTLMELSAAFASESGLASRRILEIMDAVSRPGMASMAMLGNSLFAIGDTKSISRTLRKFGVVKTCTVDTDGPRVL